MDQKDSSHSQQYSQQTHDYFATNTYFGQKVQDSMSEMYEETVREILEQCKFVNTRTFHADVERVVGLISDPCAPRDIRLILGEWLYRKVNLFYRPTPEDITKVCDFLIRPIAESENIVLKGLYLHYHNVRALLYLSEHFFLHRHPDKFFIIQMLNDVQLIQNTPSEQMLSHFLKWIRKTKSYDQQCNLLDVLLRHFPMNEEVKEVHTKMKYGDKTRGKLVDLYQDQQNAHDEDISEETMKAAGELMLWYRDNKYDFEPDHGEYFEPREVLDQVLLDLGESIHDKKLLDEIVSRARIDTTTFECGCSIMSLFISLGRYISLSPSKRELIKRLEEEFKEMNGLCSSGYVNRFINVLQGFDDRYSVKIPFKKQLQAALCHHINLALQTASEEVIAGSYEEEYRYEYLEFLEYHSNLNLPKMIAQYGKEDVEKNIVVALDELSGLPKHWKFENGSVRAIHST